MAAGSCASVQACAVVRVFFGAQRSGRGDAAQFPFFSFHKRRFFTYVLFAFVRLGPPVAALETLREKENVERSVCG